MPRHSHKDISSEYCSFLEELISNRQGNPFYPLTREEFEGIKDVRIGPTSSSIAKVEGTKND